MFGAPLPEIAIQRLALAVQATESTVAALAFSNPALLTSAETHATLTRMFVAALSEGEIDDACFA